MQDLGFSEREILADTQLESERLDDADYLADPWQCNKLITNMIKLTGNEALAFELSKDIDINDFGVVGYAMLSSKNAREAVNLWINYSHYLVGMLIQMKLNESRRYWQLEFKELVRTEKAFIFCFEELLLFALNIGEKVVGVPFNIRQLELSYTPPTHYKLYKKMFDCPIKFNCAETVLTVESPRLDTPLKSNNKELHEICLNHCDQVMRQISRNSPLATRIRTLLLESTGHIPGLDEVATKLNYSTRSLKRHLHEQDLSYRKLVNEYRNDMAKEYLNNSHLTVKEIAYVLGYDDTSSFRRAFKSWNGLTVSEFQGDITIN